MLQDKETKVLQIIQSDGPKLPTELTKAVGVESYIASAILSTLVKNGHLHNSNRKIGSSLIYYIDGQEETVRQMLLKELNVTELKALETIKKMRVALENELYPQERYLMNDLKDFVTQLKLKTDDNQEITCWKYYEVSDEELKNIVKSKLVPKKEPEAVKEELILIKEKTVRKKAVTLSGFGENVNKYLQGIDADTTAVIRSKPNELVFLIKIPTIIGSQSFMLFALNKKSITETDLSKIYVESSKERKPVLLIVANELGSKAKKYVEKHFGDVLKIIKI
jgi:hypothetical protein